MVRAGRSQGNGQAHSAERARQKARYAQWQMRAGKGNSRYVNACASRMRVTTACIIGIYDTGKAL